MTLLLVFLLIGGAPLFVWFGYMLRMVSETASAVEVEATCSCMECGSKGWHPSAMLALCPNCSGSD